MRRRTPLKRTVLVSTGLLLVVALLVLVFVHVDRVVVAQGRLAGGASAVRAPSDGRIERVLVRCGDVVHPGDALLVMDHVELKAERAQVEAQIAALDARAQALTSRVEHLRTSAQASARRASELELEEARLRVESLDRRVATLEKLVGEGLASQLSLNETLTDRDVARVQRQRAELALADLPAQQTAELAALDAELREATRHVDERRLQAAELARRESRATVVADVEARVIGEHIDELAGRSVHAGDELLRLAHGAANRFEGVVGDLGQPHVRLGQTVKLRVDAYPWLVHGTVEGRVASLSTASERAGAFPVEVELAHADTLALCEGMHAQARILVKEHVRLGALIFEELVDRGAP